MTVERLGGRFRGARVRDGLIDGLAAYLAATTLATAGLVAYLAVWSGDVGSTAQFFITHPSWLFAGFDPTVWFHGSGEGVALYVGAWIVSLALLARRRFRILEERRESEEVDVQEEVAA